MTIAAGAAGAWFADTASAQTVALPAHAAGTLLVVIAACKANPIASADPTIVDAGWSRVSSFVDGTVNGAIGLGSIRQAVFYRVASSSSEPDPAVSWGILAEPGAVVALAFTKAGNEVWVPPVVIAAAIPNNKVVNVNMGSNPGIVAGDLGIAVLSVRDDITLTVPSWSANGTTLGAAVVSPAAQLAAAIADDMAATAVYRAVTAGPATASVVITATESVAETGSAAFIRLRVAPATPKLVTPGAATLRLTSSAPTVLVTANKRVVPAPAQLRLTSFAPTVATPRLVTPSPAQLRLVAFAPMVKVTDHKRVEPAPGQLELVSFAPTVRVSDHQRVMPAPAQLRLVSYAPDVEVTTFALHLPGAELAITAVDPHELVVDYGELTGITSVASSRPSAKPLIYEPDGPVVPVEVQVSSDDPIGMAVE